MRIILTGVRRLKFKGMLMPDTLAGCHLNFNVMPMPDTLTSIQGKLFELNILMNEAKQTIRCVTLYRRE